MPFHYFAIDGCHTLNFTLIDIIDIFAAIIADADYAIIDDAAIILHDVVIFAIDCHACHYYYAGHASPPCHYADAIAAADAISFAFDAIAAAFMFRQRHFAAITPLCHFRLFSLCHFRRWLTPSRLMPRFYYFRCHFDFHYCHYFRRFAIMLPCADAAIIDAADAMILRRCRRHYFHAAPLRHFADILISLLRHFSLLSRH
jgi:hypothetical protein